VLSKVGHPRTGCRPSRGVPWLLRLKEASPRNEERSRTVENLSSQLLSKTSLSVNDEIIISIGVKAIKAELEQR
jgi:hypothetical protein